MTVALDSRLALSFVIPVRNDATRLDVCLASIAHDCRSRADVEVIVVDNGSEDDSREVAARRGARVICLPGARVAELRNAAAAQAHGRALAFVDADHEIADGWVDAALARLAEPGVGGAGAPCYPPPRATWVQRMYDRFRRHPKAIEDTPWLGAGNLAVTREAFDRAGGFDATLVACEDVDFCMRLRAAGYRLVAEPAMINFHFGDPRTLRDLARSELWRGRDNLRVTLRGEASFRSYASLAVSVAILAAIAAGTLGVLARRADWTLAAFVLVAGLTAARTATLLARGERITPRLIVQALGVAVAYDAARALALVWPARHRRARLAVAAPALGRAR